MDDAQFLRDEAEDAERMLFECAASRLRKIADRLEALEAALERVEDLLDHEKENSDGTVAWMDLDNAIDGARKRVSE